MESQRVSVVAIAVFLAGLCVLSGLNAAPIQCNNGSGIQISEDGHQMQSQTGPGCQTQTSEDGTQSQGQISTGNGTQSQSQCSGASCAGFATFPPLTFPPLTFPTFAPMRPFAPITWRSFPQMNFGQQQAVVSL
ncbi:uncharacterized protein LOC108093976 [Drosophila ficusphila]|uniref:uncharacterized protein LOC108093976 n=1 Tax=Drosophila ficusphila TaxID=30025 RepID=UPI0007E681B4|nr:uncharacterized protein LOC108093976 [Drosophila ficusphila]